MTNQPPGKHTPLNIALIYIYLGFLWVLLSSQFIARIFHEPLIFRLVETVNHGLFIFLTAGILYLLIHRGQQEIIRPQQLLRRVNRALKVFIECNKSLIRATNEQELMEDVCRTFVNVGGYRLAWVGIAENDEEKNIRPVAQWGDTWGYLKTLKVTWSDTDWGGGPTGIAIRTGTPAVVQHIPTDPNWELWRDEAARHGFASSISLPLLEDGVPFGALIIYAGEPDAFHRQEVELLRELADDLSYGIATLRMRIANQRVKQERILLATTIEQAMDGVMAFTPEGHIQYVNPAFVHVSGYRREEVLGQNIDLFLDSGQNRAFYQALAETLAKGESRTDHFVNRRRDGVPYEIEARISPVIGPAGTIITYAAVLRDVTHESQLERQLRQAQKMEAIATLAGGIAHDFNNILAAIITNTEMALDDIEADTTVREHLEIVLQAGFRAKNVVRQIRTLSCQGEKEREPVQIELVAKECIKLLRASLPSTIDIPRKLVAGLGTVLIDPTQIHQIIMNLCTNAADAMREGGGTLSVSLARVEIGPDAEPSLPLLPSGHYLQLTVADNGHGMDNRTMERIFDPFFTTKGQGRGTGLGLSVVHAIVKNHQGAITVESVPGQGSVFRVFLPRVADPIARTEEIPAAAPLPRGKGESILLVDDEETFVFAVQKMLEHLGYRVVAGTDSREALEVFRAQSDQFDLIITDQTMPNLTGDRLAREMLKIRPDIPVILCSGSDPGTGSLSLREANSIGISELVTKPMDRRELAGVVRRVLDSR